MLGLGVHLPPPHLRLLRAQAEGQSPGDGAMGGVRGHGARRAGAGARAGGGEWR